MKLLIFALLATAPSIVFATNFKVTDLLCESGAKIDSERAIVSVGTILTDDLARKQLNFERMPTMEEASEKTNYVLKKNLDVPGLKTKLSADDNKKIIAFGFFGEQKGCPGIDQVFVFGKAN